MTVPTPESATADGVHAADAVAGAADETEPVESDDTSTQAESGAEDAASQNDAVAQAAAMAAQLEELTAERDDYLDQLQRQRAEFQNFRRRMEAERKQQIAAGVGRLVESLLPVLDGCDAAITQGHTEVEAVRQALLVALGKAGLERIDAIGQAFDPTQHEAVTIEQAPVADARTNAVAGVEPTDDTDGAPDDAATSDIGNSHQVVTAELRSGFRFDGRVLRAAMVKVRTA